MIRQAIDSSSSDYDREKLQERLAKISGGVAVLKVRGRSPAPPPPGHDPPCPAASRADLGLFR